MESAEDSRYSRQILFQPIGPEGQEALDRSRVAVVGLGALGTVLSTQLARAGVGFLRLIDRDIIEPSNLQRQTLYDEADAKDALPKAAAARDKLMRANSAITVEAVIADVTWRNAEDLLGDVDVILDGTDNFQIRYLINDVAVKRNIAWAYGGAVSSYGTAAFLRPDETPCLACLFGSDQGGGHDTCDTVGVIAPIVSVIASYQVAETLKYLTGRLERMAPGLLTVDVWNNEWRTIRFPARSSACPCCTKRQFSHLAAQTDALALSMCGRRTVQVKPATPLQLPLTALGRRLASVGRVHTNDYLLRCDLGDAQISVFADGRALIHGVDDPAQARSLYARYIGM